MVKKGGSHPTDNANRKSHQKCRSPVFLYAHGEFSRLTQSMEEVTGVEPITVVEVVYPRPPSTDTVPVGSMTVSARIPIPHFY